MCVLDNTLFVSGVEADDSTAVKAYDMRGRRIASFASTYRSPNALVNSQLLPGRVECDEENQMVLLSAASALGEIRAYRPDGTPVWAAIVSNFIPVRVLDIDSSGYSVETPAGGHHRIAAFRLISPGTLLLQVEFVGSRSVGTPVRRVETVLVDATTGKASSTSFAYPVFAAATNDLAVSVRNAPYPHATLWTLSSW
jgi:hypothetical protein